MKNSPENTIITTHEDYTLNELIPDVVYTIWITAEKDGLKGDPTDPIRCHTPRCGELFTSKFSILPASIYFIY